MARYKKNVKRIDPRYFLHETVDRNDDGSALEEKFKGIPAGAATPGKQLKARGSRADRCADGDVLLAASDNYYCCNALYLYSIYGSIHNLGWQNIPEKKKIEFKKFSKNLRNSNLYS